ncbi:hypothetical protein DN402_24035 [Streptomyces sp. SW4]|nr:hypothetical protein DN402_24035 [Streptomyces sp. SW4]
MGPPYGSASRPSSSAPYPGRPPPRAGGAVRRGAAPRAGEGAVEVPSARVAVVHDAGRLDSAGLRLQRPL